MALSPNLLPLPAPPSSSLADLMKPSLQMKHNFKDRNVVRRSQMIYAPGRSLAAVSLITSDTNKGLEHLGPGTVTVGLPAIHLGQPPAWAFSASDHCEG